MHKNSIFNFVKNFLKQNSTSNHPFLLALSGGPDSLCLFYSLLYCQQETSCSFHIAHIDHGWRKESKEEARYLQNLAHTFSIPFHLKVLDCSNYKGNLEAYCRQERYQFFGWLHQQIQFEAVLTGHHQNDQIETLFKRMCEGSHWSNWFGLEKKISLFGLPVLRPLLSFNKVEIEKTLSDLQLLGFVDQTNFDCQYLRARLRQEIFPWLEKSFGKNVESNFAFISKDMTALNAYFENKVCDFLTKSINSPFGICLNLQHSLPPHLLEINYLLRLFFKQQGLTVSRFILDKATSSLQKGDANLHFEMSHQQIWIDRHRLFLIKKNTKPKSFTLNVHQGEFERNGWGIVIAEEEYSEEYVANPWELAWKGEGVIYLPLEDFQLAFLETNKRAENKKQMKKKWNQEKIPAFFYDYFPLVWKSHFIYSDFLTKQKQVVLKKGQKCWKIHLQSLHLKKSTDDPLFCLKMET